MASTVAFRREDFDEEFLTCQICLEEYKEPKLLPCCHSFCTTCTKRYVGKRTEFECPICRDRHVLSEKGIDGLPSNFVVNNLKDFFAIQEGQTTKILCQSCDASSETALSWCNDCGHFLCVSCDLAHRSMRCLRDHDVKSLRQLQQPGQNIAVMKRKMRCSKHGNQEMIFFCEICEIPICTACTIIDHNPNMQKSTLFHQPVDLESALERHRLELRRLVRQARLQEKPLIETQKTIAEEINKLSARKQLVEERIDNIFDEIISKINARRVELRAELRMVYEPKYADLKSQKDELDAFLQNVRRSCEFTEQAIRHGSGAELMAVKKLVRDRLHDLALRCPLRIIIQENGHIDVNIKYEELERITITVNRLGNIRSSTTLPSLSNIRDIGQGMFCISTYDYNGHPRKDGGDPIEINLIKSPIDKSNVSSTCTDQQDGTYVLKFCLDDDDLSSCRLGNEDEVRVTFSVLIFGREIENSPFHNKIVKLHSLHYCNCQPIRGSVVNSASATSNEAAESEQAQLV
ncbi:tripartite motif-containing protein 2-like [Glandiceps talaboti]